MEMSGGVLKVRYICTIGRRGFCICTPQVPVELPAVKDQHWILIFLIRRPCPRLE